MRRTKEEAEKTRAAILASAERLFLDKGVAHTSLDQIARDAGVTRGAVYWHFQNKAHLFHEMLDQVRLPPEQMAERLCTCDRQQPLQALIALRDLSIEAIAALASNEQKRRIFTILLHRCEFTEELRDAEERHDAFINQFIDMCEKLLQNAADHLRPGVTPRLAARSLHALMVGLFTDWTRDPQLFAAQTEARALIDPLFRGLVRDWPDDRGEPHP
ncbi:TetR family transcriptional regulator [Pseudomonas lopnurensis]|uniref:TetR family transcriptional regulator n=1 Tax=Pseudomonas lopnurensis TaxID=1477517 RepID=UPI0018799B7D|nr:TetR family transcriptional regulator [Pseudomonas lopnurensis]MBE7375034.1 TetR family transcriptional regulator [Pseudomonas lopnurensis]